jgi:hypothetical protein
MASTAVIIRNFKMATIIFMFTNIYTWHSHWVVPEKIHTPPTWEISAVRRGRGEKIVSDNNKCIRTSKGGRGVNFQFPPWGWCRCFLEWPIVLGRTLHIINSLILITTLWKCRRGGRFTFYIYIIYISINKKNIYSINYFCAFQSEVSQTEINIFLHEQWLNPWTECKVPLKCNEGSICLAANIKYKKLNCVEIFCWAAHL